MTKEEYISLYEKYIAGKCTPEEEAIVNQHHDEFQLVDYEWDSEHMGDKAKVKAYIINRLNKNINRPVVLRYRMLAAAVLLAVAAAGYYFINVRHVKQNLTVKAQKAPGYNDVAPGTNKAVLTLADGSKIALNDTKNGILAKQGNTSIKKTGLGQLAYVANSVAAQVHNAKINTLSTPAGGEFQIVLPDGTKVWLNAASSLRFPTFFSGKERNVELTGEAYFEVAKNPAMPFRVKVNQMNVTVLGTHFNINAYEGEKTIKTTLLEGSVKITNGNAMAMLKPGQQGSLAVNGDLQVKEVNTEEDVAWKNGLFIFNHADIQSIMRQLARWYDVDVVYQGNVPDDEFMGKISRNAKLSEVLKVLELTNVHFQINDKKIIILP